MIEKILLADSGTGRSEDMLNALLAIPSIQRAMVTVLHVVPPQTSSDTMTEKWEEGGKTLAKAVQALKMDQSRISAMLREGDPKDQVLKAADEVNADLIIMGSRGLKRLVSILENSVSQYVFQLSSRPMLLVKDDVFVRTINRIAVAVDKSESSKQALQMALFLARDIKGGQVTLINVDSDPKATEKLGAEAEKASGLADAIVQAKQMGVTYKAIVTTGKAGEAICRVADETKADLLVLGSPDRRPSIAKGLPDLDRLLGTSLSDYVRVYANCPVLLTRTIG
ncbi:MAG: universal stress protein [Leptolyngbya sp. Prado105]|jgi:nucleotide-binding universal stress UspA family protein|nr:universal stress protein [Leptolyngbya sp. Prado105]